MTTIGMTQERGRTISPSVTSVSKPGRLLLACGILSSLLYVLTDVLGGLRYQGYSFTSQAISELGAIGAPSKAFVDPLFMAYNVLALAFGIGVLRVAGDRARALRITGAALTGYGVIGLVAGFGNSFFAMRQRGAGSLVTDAPHIILTVILVLLLLIAIGAGAFALGNRFRVYSLATLATVVLFGALTGRYATQVAAGQATPGMGIIERVDVYAALLWLAVLAVALLRRGSAAPRGFLS
jgi:hypothetical membrane protein